MSASRLAWLIAIVDVVAFAATGPFDPSGDVVGTVLFAIGIGSFAAVGALLRTRVPGNPIGILLLAAGTLLCLAMVLVRYGAVGALQVPPSPWSGGAELVGSTLFVYPFALALIGVPLVFPDGRLPSRRFRWVVGVTVAGMAAWSLGAFVGTIAGGSPDGTPATGSSGGDTLLLLRDVLQLLFVGSLVVGFGAGVVAVALRFRRGDPVQRQQVKWLLAVVGLAAVVLPLSFVPVDGSPELGVILSDVAILTLFALPLVIGLAVLRYRLFEIDRLVSRTIAYAVVTAVLAAVFLATNLGLQTWLAPAIGGSTLGVAASTLLVAALFQPVRRAVQGPIDRRFNRARIDGERVLAAFGDRVREEVDLASLNHAVLATADEAVRPATAGLWLKAVQA